MVCAFDKPTYAERMFGPVPLPEWRRVETYDRYGGPDIFITSLELHPKEHPRGAFIKLGLSFDGTPQLWTVHLTDKIFPHRKHDHPNNWVPEYVVHLLGGGNDLSRRIWPVEEALSKQLRKRGEKRSFWQLMADLDDDTISQRIEAREKLRSLIGLCGLTQSEAATVLGISHDTIRQRLTGHRPAPDPDAEIAKLVRVWQRIEAGEVADLPAGAKAQSAILAFARQAKMKQ